ncbi:MAG: hypothetical protein ACRC1P_04400 [Cellulosilyticaceae bacterium]
MGIKNIFSKFKNTEKTVSALNVPTNNIQEFNLTDLDTLGELAQLESERIKQENLAYHLNLQKNNTNLACGYIEWNAIQINFFVSVLIPQSYALSSRSDYGLGVTIDSHFIKFIETQETKPATIYVEDEQGEIVNMQGVAKVNKTKISGLLVYNSLLTGFEATHPMTDQKVAVFNQVGTVFVDRILGYVCSECPEGENPLRDYAITLVASPEVTIILPDSQVTVVEGSEEFFALIEESRVQRIIGKKYTLIISPSPEPIS